ncbi:tnf receptor-associated factor 4 [Plakobranchus ocellatus]|uniref:Tnf receptor-associated factor 4 n=1 Tax=Plakobranchus ocellatus TaxID=259542 RepID=A0AAV4CDW9_9GAST|nr:tnf receptor-associated factor 4 [Plakobranchus ocellatus]
MPGYSFKFVDRPRRRCFCPLCRLPMRDPVVVRSCGHRFCDVCLQEYLSMVATHLSNSVPFRWGHTSYHSAMATSRHSLHCQKVARREDRMKWE